MSEYNLMQILDLVRFIMVIIVSAYVWFKIQSDTGLSHWYWIRLDWIKGDFQALAKVLSLLSAILVFKGKVLVENKAH